MHCVLISHVHQIVVDRCSQVVCFFSERLQGNVFGDLISKFLSRLMDAHYVLQQLPDSSFLIMLESYAGQAFTFHFIMYILLEIARSVFKNGIIILNSRQISAVVTHSTSTGTLVLMDLFLPGETWFSFSVSLIFFLFLSS